MNKNSSSNATIIISAITIVFYVLKRSLFLCKESETSENAIFKRSTKKFEGKMN